MELMSGNEAIAQGAWEAGCSIGVAYPGTPSTETLEAFAAKEGVYAEWCVNEKVAVEVGIGASAAGARVLATMKHVGVNVAADPLFTAAYTGVGGGFVILAADDPGMYSSQNEQDSHYYAQAAAIPCLDPADSAEALAFARDAFDISERFDVPVLLRSSVRISHTKTPVAPGERVERPLVPYEKDPAKWVMMPAFAKPRRAVQLARIDDLREWAETCPYNEVVRRGDEVGVVCAGAAYQHVVEALPGASVFKLGLTWPLPAAALRVFAGSVERLYVVEEGSCYLTDAVAACGVAVSEPPCALPRAGELSPGLVRAAFGLDTPPHADAAPDVPARPPALCPGCPHRLVFKELARMRAIVTGDIGCYTLGALPPLSAMDTTVDMGASVSMAHGFELALAGVEHRPVVAVIGDSTFAHSGLSSLISTVYNRGAGTVCVLDNRTTAMTGRQGNPFNGVTLQNRPSRELNIEAVVAALGVEDVRTVDPNDAAAVRTALKEAVSTDDISVIVFRSPCVLLERKVARPLWVNASCTACGSCATLGCPAIGRDEQGIALIDAALCIGCGQCVQYCRFNAIVPE
ncbi:MAG: 4Fe-4S binding protein [Adlercreutzia caecimuris]|jgi:indolepyruvate ferredoxin oxidoreductase alpha subunit|uniref:Indolepyruvate oxidoreductase subunit IorA n=1 Tax=Adlercreutzia caecimuris TaxID=671266 RepID=A0A4S4G6F4_9ACTN|nr:thiamine pyrophosphate-dependent enzyme [Adlercreutzia caecimuris]MCI9208552.1 4Fe-4S binding protein [Adlercreutzia caecimuris]THG38305.1 indolepyruvate ferredoxin oxidoreductase subunit alpha [Adlercreutzia caecimuris]